jgi:DNA-binding LacI/PurR family transcriptional regulator
LVNPDEPKARVANIFDVARLAGVSHQTVSRVVNDIPNVRPATKARVEDAIRQLRYRPSTAARALVSKRSRTIGLITSGSPDFGPSSIVIAFNHAARAARYNVSISTVDETDAASIRASVEQLLGQNVEAIVLVVEHESALETVQSLELGVPVLAVESGGRAGLRSVSIDQFSGGRIATDHLVSLGHRVVLHVAGPADSSDAVERERGWRASLSEHGLVAHAPKVGDWSPRSGYRIGAELAADRSFTAVFCANDEMALGLLLAFREAGIRVPEDVSIVGFDDIPASEFFIPPLTTVRQDFTTLGGDVMAAIVDILGDGEPGTASTAPELVLRRSTAPPQQP